MPDAVQSNLGSSKPFVALSKPFAPEDEAALREALKRCSPSAFESAVQYRIVKSCSMHLEHFFLLPLAQHIAQRNISSIATPMTSGVPFVWYLSISSPSSLLMISAGTIVS